LTTCKLFHTTGFAPSILSPILAKFAVVNRNSTKAMKWPTALICILALTCCNCRYAPPPSYVPGAGSGSTVFGQPAPVPASSVPNLAVDSEAQQRRVFPTSDFAYGFEENDFQTPAGTQSSLVSLLRCTFYSSSIYYSHLGRKSVLAAVCEQQPSACYPSW